MDAYASRSHYLDHLAPVWRALGASRGHLLVGGEAEARAVELGLGRGEDTGRRGDVILVASWIDAAGARAWPTVALMEHGVGQSYRESHPAYAGGQRCGRVDLFLCPNDRVAAANRVVCPDARVEVVGTPWLDELARAARRPDVDAAVSFHWDCELCPETRCTVDDWWPAVGGLTGACSLLGHGHPRAQPTLFPRWQDAGVATAARFEEVARRARVFVADNTSCLYYAAALGLGVVVLDSPRYRRGVEHGLRFWEMAGVGVRCDRGAGLVEAVHEAMAGPTADAGWIVGELFPHRGCAVERTVGALVGHDASEVTVEYVQVAAGGAES